MDKSEIKKKPNNAVNTAKIQQKRVIGIPFVKGQSGNPKGKPKGAVNEVTKFKLAIAAFEKEQGKDIYKLILEKANRYPQVLIAIFKALVPQQTESNIKIETIYEAYEKLTDQELVNQANAIIKRTGTFNTNKDIN